MSHSVYYNLKYISLSLAGQCGPGGELHVRRPAAAVGAAGDWEHHQPGEDGDQLAAGPGLARHQQGAPQHLRGEWGGPAGQSAEGRGDECGPGDREESRAAGADTETDPAHHRPEGGRGSETRSRHHREAWPAHPE